MLDRAAHLLRLDLPRHIRRRRGLVGHAGDQVRVGLDEGVDRRLAAALEVAAAVEDRQRDRTRRLHRRHRAGRG